MEQSESAAGVAGAIGDRPVPLDELAIHRRAYVTRVSPPSGTPEWSRWLTEIGFIPGERVMVLVRGVPGGDPLVVRVGDSTFALRRAEAACVEVAEDSA